MKSTMTTHGSSLDGQLERGQGFGFRVCLLHNPDAKKGLSVRVSLKTTCKLIVLHAVIESLRRLGHLEVEF